MVSICSWKLTLILNFSFFIVASSLEKTDNELYTNEELLTDEKINYFKPDAPSKAPDNLKSKNDLQSRSTEKIFQSSDASELSRSEALNQDANGFAFEAHPAKPAVGSQDFGKQDHFDGNPDGLGTSTPNDHVRSSTTERNLNHEFKTPQSSHNLQVEEQDNSLLVSDIEEENKDTSSSASARTRRSSERWQSSVSETDERFERAAISRQAPENQLHKPRNRNRDARRRKVRVTEVEELVKEAIAATVSAALRQELEPLHTALRIVKLDTFTEGIVRQLSTLEHIQSKLLTEYGEMREAVSQASRTAQDLAVQIVGLDAKVGALVKDSHHHKMTESSSASGGGSSSRGSDGASCSRTEELKAVLMQASAAFSARLTATERRVKDDLSTLETRLSEAVKRSQVAFDSRLTTISADTSRILNKTCRDTDLGGDEGNLVHESSGQSLRFPFGSGLPLGPSYPTQRSFPSPGLSRSHSTKSRVDSILDQGGTLNESPSSQGPQADRSTDSLTLLPFPSWGRAEMVNLAVVSRLAAEIATRISRDTLGYNLIVTLD